MVMTSPSVFLDSCAERGPNNRQRFPPFLGLRMFQYCINVLPRCSNTPTFFRDPSRPIACIQHGREFAWALSVVDRAQRKIRKGSSQTPRMRRAPCRNSLQDLGCTSLEKTRLEGTHRTQKGENTHSKQAGCITKGTPPRQTYCALDQIADLLFPLTNF